MKKKAIHIKMAKFTPNNNKKVFHCVKKVHELKSTMELMACLCTRWANKNWKHKKKPECLLQED